MSPSQLERWDQRLSGYCWRLEDAANRLRDQDQAEASDSLRAAIDLVRRAQARLLHAVAIDDC